MGRRKQEEVAEEIENLEEQVSEETEIQEEALTEDSTEVVASEEEKEEKPKRQRRSRKVKAEIEAAGRPEDGDGNDNAEVVAEEEQVEESKPKRQRSSRKQPISPEAQIEFATEAMQKTMEEMVKHWAAVQSITGSVASQLEKVAHIVKPSIQDFVSTNDSLVQPKNESSQFAMRFTAAASIVAVLLSLVSMSLSQSVRTVALNAEATRIANSQLFQSQSIQPKAPELALQRPKELEVLGPRTKASHPKAKRF